MGELMGLLSKAKPGSQGSIGIMPLDDSLLEPLDDVVVVVVVVVVEPPMPMPPTPAPAVPEDKEFAVPPSPGVEDPGAEHAAKPKTSNPTGKLVSKSVLFIHESLSKHDDDREVERVAPLPISRPDTFDATSEND